MPAFESQKRSLKFLLAQGCYVGDLLAGFKITDLVLGQVELEHLKVLDVHELDGRAGDRDDLRNCSLHYRDVGLRRYRLDDRALDTVKDADTVDPGLCSPVLAGLGYSDGDNPARLIINNDVTSLFQFSTFCLFLHIVPLNKR